MPSRKTQEALREGVTSELKDVALGDERRNARALILASKMARRPNATLPDMASNTAELEAMYRFFSNEDITYDKLLKPHIEATANRCAAMGLVLAVHDMSEFTWTGRRAGLMEAAGNSTFWGHFSLAVSAPKGDKDVPLPLGLLGLQPFLSNRGSKGVTARGKPVEKDSRAARYNTPRSEKESFLWDVGALTAVQAAGPNVEVIHVADQECDDYAFVSLLVEDGLRFVIRGSPKRWAVDESASDGRRAARSIVERTKCLLTREVKLSGRKHAMGSHPRRTARLATLEVRGAPVTFAATKAAQSSLPEVTINAVHVIEKNPPRGEEPIEWLLYTSEPIETAKQLAFVVNAYCARWCIEEFFKVLKTGCAYEERQLESGHALLNLLALCIPLAWRMLLLRTAARSTYGEYPASLILPQRHIALLGLLQPKLKLRKNTSTRTALLAIAALGGHLKNNGDPGWLTLWRGYRRILEADELAARLHPVVDFPEM